MQKKIVMIGTHYETKGGVSAVVNAYRATGFFDRWLIEYLVTHRDGSKREKFIQVFKALLRFLLLISYKKVDLLHIHTSSDASFWRKSVFFTLSKIRGIPFIIHMHGGTLNKYYSGLGKFRQALMKYLFRSAGGVIALSDEWHDWITNNLGVTKVHVLFNPVSIPALNTHIRDEATLLFLGQFGHNKGIYTLLAAVAKLAKNHPTISLLAGGDGELEQVRAQAQALGISDRVNILGWVTGDKKAEVLASASIYVLPSYAEGMPMSILEAMAAGLPIVSTPVGGIPSVIQNGVEGFLITPGHVDELTDALQKLLLDANLRRTMGEAARKKAIEKFSAEKIITQLEAIYQDVKPTPLK